MKCQTPLVAGLLMALLPPSLCHSQHWPRFRGPNAAGLADPIDIPISFTQKDYRWSAQLPGTGHSSPVVWNDRLFLTACDSDNATRFVVCLDADTGKSLWVRKFPSRTYRQHADNSYAASTPAVDDRHVYVIWTTPDEYALIALNHDGTDAWRANLGRYASQHGSGTSPVVFHDSVIVTNDQEGPESSVLAFDRLSGQVRWKTPRKTGSMAASTPCIFHPPGHSPQLVLTSRMEGFAAVDPTSGKLLWQAPDAFAFRVVASPVVAGDLVIGNCGEGPNGKTLIALRPPPDGNKPEVAWQMLTHAPYVPTPLCKDNLLFTLSDTGTVSCLRAATGQVVWQQRIGGAYYSSPVCAGDRLYCVSKKGDVIVLAASETYQLLGRASLGELCYSTPAVARGRIYFRTLSHLICVGN